MYQSIWNKKLIGSLALALVLTACKSTPMNTSPAAVEDKSLSQNSTKPAGPGGGKDQ